MSADGEPDLEPVDLEPVELEPADGRDARDQRPPRRAARRPAWIWIGGIAVVLAAWGAIALTSGGDGAKQSAPTTAAPAPPSRFVPTVDRPTLVASQLATGLAGVGTGRYAAVVDDRLYLVEPNRSAPRLLALPEGHVSIEDQSGSSLLVSTFESSLVVSSAPAETVTLATGDVAFARADGKGWWIREPDGTISSTHGGPVFHEPAGFSASAAVADGFVGTQAPGSYWVLWDGSATRLLGAAGFQLLAVAPHDLAFKHDCGYGGCRISISDLDRKSETGAFVPHVPDFAAFSPDGRRLAMSTTLGDVYVFDPAKGEVLAQTTSRNGQDGQVSALTFTWTPDGRFLLVVQPGSVEVLRASDGATRTLVNVTDGLEQLAALP